MRAERLQEFSGKAVLKIAAGQLEQTPGCSEPSLDSLPEDVSSEWKVAERKYHRERGPAAGTILPEWRSQSDIYVKVHLWDWPHRQK